MQLGNNRSKYAILVATVIVLTFTCVSNLIRNQVAISAQQTASSPTHFASILDDDRTSYLLAFQAWHNQDTISAINLMEKVNSAAPQDPFSNLLLAEWLYDSGNTETAYEYWSRINSGHYLLNRAAQFVENEAWFEAEYLLNLSLGRYTDDFSSNYLVATSYAAVAANQIGSGNLESSVINCERANHAFNSAANSQPDLAHVHILYANHLNKCGLQEQALNQLSLVNSDFSIDQQAWALHETGRILIGLGQQTHAQLAFAKSTCLAPSNPTYLHSFQSLIEDSVDSPTEHACDLVRNS